MGKGEKCAVRTVLSLIIAGCACRLLMKYFLNACEDVADEFEGAKSEGAAESAEISASDSADQVEQQNEVDPH